MISCRDVAPPTMFRLRTGAVVQVLGVDTKSPRSSKGRPLYHGRRVLYLVLTSGRGRNRPGDTAETYLLAFVRRVERQAVPDDFKEMAR